VEKGRPLFFDEYMDRFFRSAEMLGLHVPMSRESIAEAIGALLKANRRETGRIRVVLTGGDSPDGFAPGRENLMMLFYPPIVLPEEPEGIKVLTHRHLREFPGAKTLNYLTAVQGLPRMRSAGASELLFHDGRRVLEAARSNIFLLTAEGILVTPGEGMLRGITRKRVLTVCRQNPALPEIGGPESRGIEERDVALSELATAREVFLTGSGRLLMPVVDIDGEPVGDGRVGPVALSLFALLREDSRAYLEAVNA
jgi:D-alanine transaminase/branched-chain amino acid aminotransferase